VTSELLAVIGFLALLAVAPLRALYKPIVIIYIVVLGGVPFAALGLGGLNVPFVSILAALLLLLRFIHFVIDLESYGTPRGRSGIVSIAFGGTVLLAVFSLLLTGGAFGRADYTEFGKWALAVLSVFAVRNIGKGLAARVFCFSVCFGAVFAVAAAYLPVASGWLDYLSVIGYVRSGSDARFFLQGGSEVAVRVTGTYVDPNIAALFFLGALCLSWSLHGRAVRIGVQVILIAALTLCLSRGAYLASVVAIGSTLLLRGSLSLRAKALTIGGCLLLAIAALRLPAVSSRILSSFGEGDLGAQDRLYSYSQFSTVMEGNWIAGLGWGRPEFRDSASAFRVNVVANATLAAIYRGGLLAVAGFLAVVLACLCAGAKSIKFGTSVAAGAGAAVLGMIAASMTGYSLTLVVPVVALFSLMAALACNVAELRSSQLRVSERIAERVGG
jgi:hypothetical protein